MKQPKGLYLLVFTQMWERFSFYGMRTLLVLFMIQKLNFGKAEAIGIYALFTTLVNLGGLAGGFCADRILGLRPSVFLGGWLIGMGHLCLTIEGSLSIFFLALSFIIVGSSLFSTNVKALVGQLYHDKDPQRDSGYTLFYAGINFGGFFAAVFCGAIAQLYGWHFGFGLAGLGMFIGLAVLYKYKYLLTEQGNPPGGTSKTIRSLCIVLTLFLVILSSFVLQMHELFLLILPMIGLVIALGMLTQFRHHKAFGRILTLSGFIVLYIGFFMIEDLMGSLLMIFCENQVSRTLGGFEIPSSTLIAVNPLSIILFGTLSSVILRRFSIDQGALSVARMNSIAFLLLGLAFGILYMGTQFLDHDGLVPVVYVILCFFMIALGELFIAPTLYSFCSFIAPVSLTGQLMSLVLFGRSLASFFSGLLGKATVSSYSYGESYLFAMTAITALILSFTLALGCRLRRTESVF